MRLIVLICFASALCLADTWPGYLVDAKCYAAEEGNVNPTDTLMDVDRDRNSEIRYCTASAKTKTFAIVLPGDGSALELDSAGNTKAADLVRQGGKKEFFLVDVAGERSRKTIRVSSILPAR